MAGRGQGGERLGSADRGLRPGDLEEVVDGALGDAEAHCYATTGGDSENGDAIERAVDPARSERARGQLVGYERSVDQHGVGARAAQSEHVPVM